MKTEREFTVKYWAGGWNYGKLVIPAGTPVDPETRAVIWGSWLEKQMGQRMEEMRYALKYHPVFVPFNVNCS